MFSKDTRKTEKSDQEIVNLTLEDSSFFVEIVNRYEAPLTRYIRRISYLGPEDIQDVLQDTFIRIYKNLNGYQPELKFSSWVYRITHNITIDFLRKKRIRPEGNYSEVEEEFISRISSDLSADGEILAHELNTHVSQVINSLKDSYREPIILYYFENKSYEEISDILKIPPNTVATRLSRAKSKLKQLLISQQTYE